MTLSGGSSFFLVGMEQQNSSQKMWTLMTWICTQMPLEDTAVGHTSKEPGSFTGGNHTNVSQNQYQSSGKSYLPS